MDGVATSRESGGVLLKEKGQAATKMKVEFSPATDRRERLRRIFEILMQEKPEAPGTVRK